VSAPFSFQSNFDIRIKIFALTTALYLNYNRQIILSDYCCRIFTVIKMNVVNNLPVGQNVFNPTNPLASIERERIFVYHFLCSKLPTHHGFTLHANTLQEAKMGNHVKENRFCAQPL
jgi:hypothetical protein